MASASLSRQTDEDESLAAFASLSLQIDEESDIFTGCETPSERLKPCDSLVASTSSSRQRDEESDPLAGSASKRIKSCESLNTFCVFINHRGVDVKERLAIPLHNSLTEAGIPAYLDKIDNELGDSISSNIKVAISSASVHIAIFSPNYAESAWCLAELTWMLRTAVKIIPVFYEVKASVLSDLCDPYLAAFSKFKQNNRCLDKLEEWKNSLKIIGDQEGKEATRVGEEVTSQNDVNELCKKLVSRVKKLWAEIDDPSELAKVEVEKRNIPLEVAGYKVGLDGLVHDFDMHYQKLGEERGNMVGIFGIAGSGKTTLAKELFNRKCFEYTESSFLFNVRKASVNGKFTSLQSKLFRDLFHTHKAPEDVEKGIILLKYKLKSLSRFLIVIDDVDAPEQLNALVPLYTINSRSLVIVTAREERVLKEAGISVRYRIKEMDSENGKQLFSCHAFQNESTRGYEDLVERFVGKCDGLPLSLRVLGGHALRMKDTWQRELDEIPGTMTLQSILELSYKALKEEQKDMLVDIACFFVDKGVEMAKRIWGTSECETQNALETLRDRCLVDFDEEPPTSVFRMHEEIRIFGTEKAKSRPITRVWCSPHEIWDSHNFQDILTKARNDSFRCLNSISEMCITYFLGHSATSATLQWLELNSKCFPEWIPLQCIQALRFMSGAPKRLWQSDDQAPRVLKELLCKFTKFDDTEKRVLWADWSKYSESLGCLPGLECLILKLESSLKRKPFEIEWNSFLETVMRIAPLKTLDLLGFHIKGGIGLRDCRELTKSLESLTLSKVALTSNVSISGEYFPALRYLKIEEMVDLIELDLREVEKLKRLEVLECHNLRRVLGNDMLELEILSIESCSEIEKVPNVTSMSSLKRIRIMACEYLRVIEGILSCVEDITITRCPDLQTVEGIERLEGLKSMILSDGSMWRCVSKRLPSEFTVVMGVAATSSLNTNEILNEIHSADSHSEFESREEGYQKLRSFQNSQQSFGAIILCAMVVTSGPTYMDRRPQFGGTIRLSWGSEEKMIYTIVVTDPSEISMLSHSIPRYCWMPAFHLEERGKCLQPRGEIIDGFILGMDRGRERETLSILERLTDLLYNRA